MIVLKNTSPLIRLTIELKMLKAYLLPRISLFLIMLSVRMPLSFCVCLMSGFLHDISNKMHKM